jgi:hypothetical protein
MNITISDAGASFTQDCVGKQITINGPADHPRTWYWARERWAERYDELNGAPESEEDR